MSLPLNTECHFSFHPPNSKITREFLHGLYFYSVLASANCFFRSTEKADLAMLERYALVCNEDKHSLFTDYLLFRKYHKQILSAYIEKQGITKSEMGKTLGVSKTLALTWFNKENRCPTLKVWEERLKEFSYEWINNNVVE